MTTSGSIQAPSAGIIAPKSPGTSTAPGDHSRNFSARPGPWITGTPTGPSWAAMAAAGSISVRIAM